MASSRTARTVKLVGDEPIGPQLLRKMVLYKEILDPPLALRDRAAWERI